SEFWFNPRMHQPGEQRVLGKTYAEDGVGQGRAVLLDLARRAATAHHLAEKLARAFVADAPPPALVERLAIGSPSERGEGVTIYRTSLIPIPLTPPLSPAGRGRRVALAFAKFSTPISGASRCA